MTLIHYFSLELVLYKSWINKTLLKIFFQHSYGFIQCCDRQARLFFHFSQFDGTIEHLKIGDPVEFEMTYDRRTGKPIASNVSKIAPEVVRHFPVILCLFYTLAHTASLVKSELRNLMFLPSCSREISEAREHVLPTAKCDILHIFVR